MAARKTSKPRKQVETLTHDEASRKNLSTAELEPVMDEAARTPIQVAYERRNRDLDPRLVWRDSSPRRAIGSGSWPHDSSDREMR